MTARILHDRLQVQFGGHSKSQCVRRKQRFIMSNIAKPPHLTSDGVTFSVIVEYQERECVISQDVLSNLSRSADKNLDLLATFSAYEAKITGVARRMAKAGVTTSPMVLANQNFN